ncbi:MAG: ROK family protein [Bacteroides sp.]|nr:ROK family protein [Bacteroides sp.]
MKIGIDISFGKICGVLLYREVVLATVHTPIYGVKRDTKKEIIDKMLTMIESLFTSRVKGIGISLPTKLNPDKGIVYDLSQIPHWKNIRIKTIIEEKFQVPTFINCDINCFILGEKSNGSCKRYSNIICITLDSTIGTSVILNNKLFTDSQPDLKKAKCLSQISYKCMQNFQQSYMRTLEEFLFISDTFNDDLENPSHEAWNDIKAIVARLISIMLTRFEPDVILLGGKLSSSYHHCIDTIKDYMNIFSSAYGKATKPIIPSELENARAVGAAYLF